MKRDGQRVCVCVAMLQRNGKENLPRPSDDFSMASFDLPTAAAAAAE